MIWHVNCQHEALECILAFHPTRVWQAGLSNLARLTSDREDIKGITALALCACELELRDDDPGSGPEFEEFLKSLRAYPNLEDLYFVEGGMRRYVRCPELNCKRRELTRAPVGEQRTTLVEQVTRPRKSLDEEVAKRYPSWIPPRIHYGQTHEKWEGPERLYFHSLDMDETNLGKVDKVSK